MLESASGFSMPFDSKEEVLVTLGYGTQTHPRTGEKFIHCGLDVVANHVPLLALATGVVVGVGNDATYGNFIVCRYGEYTVRYGHVSAIYKDYSASVVAGQPIAMSGAFLHIDVHYREKEIDPSELLTVLLNNVLQLEAMGIKKFPYHEELTIPVPTDYDKDQEEITSLMMRYLPQYFSDIDAGKYHPSVKIELSLRNIFAQFSSKGYLFEQHPDLGNPLGISPRAVPLASKVQNMLINDFLIYMAVCHNVYLSTWDEEQKKKLQSKPSVTE